MKEYFKGFFFCLLVAGLSGTAFAQQPAAAAPRYFAIDHGAVQYDISGAEKGKETMYFDQAGMRQAHFKSAETQKWGVMNTVTLNLQEQIIFIDPNKGLGQKRVNQQLKQLLDDPQSLNNGLLSVQLMTLLGGKKTGDENVLTRACEVWEIPSAKTKLWLWNGIVLRSEVQTPDGMVSFKAVKVDDVTAVDEAVFTIPQNIQFMDRDITQILISKR